jgi:hypothetical protein
MPNRIFVYYPCEALYFMEQKVVYLTILEGIIIYIMHQSHEFFNDKL